MENENRIVPCEEIIAHARKYHPQDDMSLIERAYAYAEDAHKDQKRMSGEPYFAHPCQDNLWILLWEGISR